MSGVIGLIAGAVTGLAIVIKVRHRLTNERWAPVQAQAIAGVCMLTGTAIGSFWSVIT